jgi:hypothetical protein
MKGTAISLLIITLAVTACKREEREAKTERVFDVNVNLENDFINIENTKKTYNAHSGDYYSGVDSIVKYGAGYVKKIDDTLKGYNLDLIVSAWVREAVAPLEGSIAISLNLEDGSPKYWNGLDVKPGNFKENQWVHVIDTFNFKKDFMDNIKEVKIFSIKTKGSDLLDVDDLRIKYVFYK